MNVDGVALTADLTASVSAGKITLLSWEGN